jgi:CubicO group peptidase (beta-lactamase class C family)
MPSFLKITGIVVAAIAVLIIAVVLFVKYKLNHIADKKDLALSMDKVVEAELKKNGLTGLTVGIYKEGRIHYKSYGTGNIAAPAVPDSNSIYELASTSKLFTTSVLQILCDKGVLHLDDKIATLLKDKVQLPPIAQQTTLRHLATHTSGFPSLPDSFLHKMTDPADPYKSLSMEDLYDYLKTCDGKKQDGTFDYSNLGMGLLGQVMALKTGMSYEALVQQELLQPLGMHNTFVTIDSTNRHKIVQGYNEAGEPNPVWTDHVLTGAGSFLSDAVDMMQFIRANLEATAPLYASLLKTHQQQLKGETGLGWILPATVDNFMGNKSVLWHNGMAGGYSSYIGIDPVSKTGVIVLSNKAKDVTVLGSRLMLLLRTQSWKQAE